MTMYDVELLRLDGDERWEEWGDDWWSHVARLGEPDGATLSLGWGGARRVFGELGIKPMQLDWGAFLYPVRKRELLRIFGADAAISPPYKRTARTPTPLPSSVRELDDAADYGLVVVECY